MSIYQQFFNSEFGPGKHKRPRLGQEDDERLYIFPSDLNWEDKSDVKIRLVYFFSLRLSRKTFVNRSDQDGIPDDLLRLVPSIDEMKEGREVKEISDINLANTKVVTLESVKFVKSWKMRECGNSGINLNSLGGFEGPLGIIYRHVFAIEVEDAAGDEIMVYFYGDWASKLNFILFPFASENQNQHDQIRLSLRNVPAKCVVPHDAAQLNEGDSCVCLVIGSNARMKFNDTVFRFDDDIIQIEVTTNQFKYNVRKTLHNEVEIEETAIDRSSNVANVAEGVASVDYDHVGITNDNDEALGPQNSTHIQNIFETSLDGAEDSVSKMIDIVKKKIVLKRKQNAKCIYHSLNELGPILEGQRTGTLQHKKINLYGIVIGFSVPFLTDRGDISMSITIVDETSENPITLSLFLNASSKVPALLRAGDVIRLHRVTVQEFRGNIQLQGRKESSYVVIRKIGDPYESIDLVHEYKLESQDLWKLGQIILSQYPTVREENTLTIGGTSQTERRTFDLTVLVTAIERIKSDDQGKSPKGYIRIWDGTGSSESDPLQNIGLPEDENVFIDGDPTVEAIKSVERAIMIINEGKSKDETMEIPRALCGRVMNVVIWEQSHWDFINEGRLGKNELIRENNGKIGKGSWVRLRNIVYERSPFGSKLIMLNRSSITPLPEYTYEVQSLLKQHDERVKRKEKVNPTSAILFDSSRAEAPKRHMNKSWLGTTPAPRKNGDNVHFIHQCIGDNAPSIFNIRAKLSNMMPNINVDVPDSIQKCCIKGDEGTIFQFAVQFEDESAKIYVIIPNDIAENQIMRCTARDLVKSEESNLRRQCVDRLTKMIELRSFYEARIKSAVIGDEKYFFLDQIDI